MPILVWPTLLIGLDIQELIKTLQQQWGLSMVGTPLYRPKEPTLSPVEVYK